MRRFNKEFKKAVAYILIFAMTVIQASALTAVNVLASSSENNQLDYYTDSADYSVSENTPETAHEHIPSDVWSFNDTYHWHQCTDPECPYKDNPEKQADYKKHEIIYSKDDAKHSVKGVCVNSCGVSANEISLKVPADSVYDGEERIAEIEGLDNWNAHNLSQPVLYYTNGNEKVENVVNVGNYTAYMTVSGNTVSGNTVSGNVVSANSVSENTIVEYTVSANFAITSKMLSSANVSLSRDTFDYTGQYFTPEITVTDGKRVLVENIDYTVSGNTTEKEYNENNDTYKIYITFTGNYKGSAIKEWSIVKYERPEGFSVVFVDDDGIEVNDISYKYTGKAITPKVRVYNDNTLLTEGIDYTVGYVNNINAVTATTILSRTPYVKVIGKNTYAKTYKKYFTIEKVSLEETVYAENAKVRVMSTYKPTIMYDGLVVKTSEYDLSKKDSYKELGKYTLTVTAKEKSNFYGSVDINVTVQNEKLNRMKITVDTKTKLYYNGESQLPSYIVEDSKSKKTAPIYLEEGVDYIVSVPEKSADAAKYQMVFCGIGDYEGYITKAFTINPYKLDIAKKNDGTVSANSSEYYNPNGVKLSTLNVHAFVDSADGTRTFDLVEGTDYKVTYSANRQASTSKISAKYTITFLGNYKGSKSYKGTFAVLKMPVTALNIVSVNKIAYARDGIFNQKPEVEFTGTDGINVTAKTADYSIKYYLDAECSIEMKGANKLHLNDGENYGTVYVEITGKKNIESDSIVSSYRVYRKLDKKSITTDLTKATISIVYPKNPQTGKDIKTIPQTGERIEPEIKVTLGSGRNAVEIDASEYRVDYTNNVLKGTGKIVVSGLGDGKSETAIGTKTKTFTISAMPLQ